MGDVGDLCLCVYVCFISIWHDIALQVYSLPWSLAKAKLQIKINEQINKHDDSCAESYSDLSQTTDMHSSRNQSMVSSHNCFCRCLIILYNTSQVKKIKICCIHNYRTFCVDYRSNCVKSLSVLSILLNIFPHFLRKKLYRLVLFPLETRTNFNKTKMLNKYSAQSTWAVVNDPRFNLGFKS